jgi:valyl-tRNA synthetase
MDTGTGQVHIAPGHGADDYMAGVQNGLPILSPVDEHGRFTEEVGVPVWAGKYVFEANQSVITHLRERGALLGEQVYEHSYPHCWRSKTPVVFRAVEQFFIRIEQVRGDALHSDEGLFLRARAWLRLLEEARNEGGSQHALRGAHQHERRARAPYLLEEARNQGGNQHAIRGAHQHARWARAPA